MGQEEQASPGGWVQVVRYQVAGYQVGEHQVVEYQVAGYQTAGNQVASYGGWGTGLGSGADTRSRYHSPDCQRPETFNPGVVLHCPTALSISAIPPTNGSEGPGRVPPGPMVSLGISGPRAQPSTPHGALELHAHQRPHQGPTLQPSEHGKYLPSPPQAALGVTVTSRQESDSEL